MLIVCGEEIDCVCGLDIGVDDYIVKFFLMIELFVCICVVLWCICLGLVEDVVCQGDIVMDWVVYWVKWVDCEIYFGLIEFCLLDYFM